VILVAEHGLHFAKEGDHRRHVEYSDLVMLRGDRYQLGEQEFGTLAEALRLLAVTGSTARNQRSRP
jgi:hypothetical protein